jgi:hypothetical protein
MTYMNSHPFLMIPQRGGSDRVVGPRFDEREYFESLSRRVQRERRSERRIARVAAGRRALRRAIGRST